MTPRWYAVTSMEYGEVVPVLDFGQGPTEYGRDFLYVRTRTAKRAKVLMVRAMRRRLPSRLFRNGKYSRPDWLDDGCPFTGMKAERVNLSEMEEAE